MQGKDNRLKLSFPLLTWFICILLTEVSSTDLILIVVLFIQSSRALFLKCM